MLSPISKSFDFLIDEAKTCAEKSIMPMRHGAVLFKHSGKQILGKSENTIGARIFGYHVPARHAEANALSYLHSRVLWRVPYFECGQKEAK